MRCKCDNILEGSQMDTGVCSTCADVGYYAAREGWTSEEGSLVVPEKKEAPDFYQMVQHEDAASWWDGAGFMPRPLRFAHLRERAEKRYYEYLALGFTPQRAYEEAVGKSWRGNQKDTSEEIIYGEGLTD